MYHLHLRKRIAKKLEPFPASTRWKRMLDKAVFVAGIVGPAMSLPQLITIYVGQDATGLAPLSWFGWAILDIPWILYGITHKERPIVICYSLWFIINVLVGVGAIIYG